VLSAEESSGRNTHSSVIVSLIETVLSNAGKQLKDIDAVAAGAGPGSYTGLRIGVATAKGLCYSLDKPLIAVSTLQSMSIGMQRGFSHLPDFGKPVLFGPMIDARRMEVYCAIYDAGGTELFQPAAEIITENSFRELREKNLLVLAGDGAMKCKPLLEGTGNIAFLVDFNASAAFMAVLAEDRFIAHKFEDLAYFEPFYLKDFVAGRPKVKGLK
jgi:tRNA threonylcarbamoyladenosine biosynthesis protein TsaB